MADSTPIISANDADLILEESSLQEATEEIIQDTTDLTHETASVIEETIDVINSTEEIEAAENAGLLSAIAVKAYANRVNSYLDKMESRFIISKDDRLKSGMQFDNPQAGLLSIGETIKNAIRKVIEWIAKAFNYLFSFSDLLINKVSQFISSRAGISKSLREKLNSLKNTDYVFIDTKVYEDILKKRAVEFEYAIKGKLSSSSFVENNGKANVNFASTVLANGLDIPKMLTVFQEILEDKVNSRIPSIESETGNIIIRDLNTQNRIEQMFINDRFDDLMSYSSMSRKGQAVDENDDSKIYNAVQGSNFNFASTLDSTARITPKTTRAIIDRNQVMYLNYSEKGMSLKAYSKFIYSYNEEAIKRIKLQVNKKDKPLMLIDDLNELVKIIDKASSSLKTMAKDSKDKANALKGWASKNIEELKSIANAKRGEQTPSDSSIFNAELRNKLAMNANMVNFFPSIVTAMISALSSAIDDGVKLIAASTVQSPEKAERSKTGDNEDGRYLLLAAPEKYDEIIDVEVID